MIKVEHEPPSDAQPAEQCCFCREETSYWFKQKDVACCPKCASQAEPEDVPTKEMWCRREKIASRYAYCGEEA